MSGSAEGRVQVQKQNQTDTTQSQVSFVFDVQPDSRSGKIVCQLMRKTRRVKCDI